MASRGSIDRLATRFHLAGFARVVFWASVDGGSSGLDGLLNCGGVRVVKVLEDVGKALLDDGLRWICRALLNIQLWGQGLLEGLVLNQIVASLSFGGLHGHRRWASMVLISLSGGILGLHIHVVLYIEDVVILEGSSTFLSSWIWNFTYYLGYVSLFNRSIEAFSICLWDSLLYVFFIVNKQKVVSFSISNFRLNHYFARYRVHVSIVILRLGMACIELLDWRFDGATFQDLGLLQGTFRASTGSCEIDSRLRWSSLSRVSIRINHLVFGDKRGLSVTKFLLDANMTGCVIILD